MGVQLLYVFVKDINRCLCNQEFCFTNDFNINYNLENKTLNIKKKSNYYCHLWGEKITNVNLLIGQNGSGKTTLFDLIASTRDRRFSLFNNRIKTFEKDKFCEWFAVYHIKDNIFVIEGLNKDLILNIENIPMETSYEYSLVIKYNYEQQMGLFENYIQFYNLENDNKNRLNEKVIVLYGRNKKVKDWYNIESSWNNDDYYFGFLRKYLDNPSFTNLYRFMSNEYKIIENTFTAKSIVCNILRSDIITSLDSPLKSDIDKAFNLKLYNGIVKPLYFQSNDLKFKIHGYDIDEANKSKWTKRQEYIIKFYEFYIIKTWIYISQEYTKMTSEQKYIMEKCERNIKEIRFEVDDYFNRVNYLESIVNIISDTAVAMFLPGEHNYYAEAIIRFAKAMDKVDEKYFLSSKKISIKITDGFDENIKRLLQIYDYFIPNNENLKNDLHNYVNIKFTNLSSGELDFINGFATLYTALDIKKYNSRFENAIIFLDEPDESFHPEWSRKYIYYLTTFLNYFEQDRMFNYQVIISTHSPFMISDVPKEYITCLKVIIKEDGEIERETIKAEFGLMSNFYDIIKNDFFISAPIGEFAKMTFDKILQRINEMKEYDEKNIRQLEGLIMGIGEAFIKKKLLDYLEKKVIELITPDDREKRITSLERELRILKGERDRID